MATPTMKDWEKDFSAASREFVEDSEIYRTPRVEFGYVPGVDGVCTRRGQNYPLVYTPSSQSRLESFIEATLNTGTGFVASFLGYKFVIAPAIGIPAPLDHTLYVTLFFTVLSITRSYLWRRFFNASVHRRVHQWLRKAHE